MKNMKKLLALLLALVMVAGTLAACGEEAATPSGETQGNENPDTTEGTAPATTAAT